MDLRGWAGKESQGLGNLLPVAHPEFIRFWGNKSQRMGVVL